MRRWELLAGTFLGVLPLAAAGAVCGAGEPTLIYGVLSIETLAELLPTEDAALAERFKAAASQVEIHVDAEDDVAITADVLGSDDADVADLGKSLGAALAVGRLEAKAEGDEKLVELLDLARASPRGDRFAVDLALPMELIQKQLLPCRR